MRFRTKLMLTFVATITGVTIALITASEMKVKQAFIQMLTREFESRMESLEKARDERSREFTELSSLLAKHPYIVESLKTNSDPGGKEAFWAFYAKNLGEKSPATQPAAPLGNAKRLQGASDILRRLGVNAIMNTEGDIRLLTHPRMDSNRRNRARKFKYNDAVAREELEHSLRMASQQTIYIPMDAGDGRTFAQEMISTPVKDPETGEVLGLFLRGGSAETEAQRSLDKFQEEFETGLTIRSGVFLDGSIYSRSLDEEFSVALSEEIQFHLDTQDGTDSELRFDTHFDGEDYYVYLDRLTESFAPRQAFQVAAFPTNRLQEDLAELRLRGSGIGVAVLLASLLIAWLLAHNLAVPIRDLTRANDAIREGSLDHRVKVRTSDEIGALAESFNEMADELKQKALYRELLGKVSDETVAQALVSGSLDLELGGEIKDVSVLFCDIRGFTQLTEHMHPNEVIEMLNEHMTAMTNVVRKHYGVVDKFVGDEIMAVFGALKSYENDAQNAALCALEMIAERERLNRELEVPIHIGVGVATGEVVAGCMGSTDRLNYTVLGSRVNLAARLCSAAGQLETVIDDATLDQIVLATETESLPKLQLKGFSGEVSAHRLLSIQEAQEISAPVETTTP